MEVRRFFADMVSPDVLVERYLTDWVYKYEELTDTMAWHNWAPHYVRDDYTFEQRGYMWYGRHGGQVSYASHPSQSVYWDGFTAVEETKPNQLPPAKVETFDSTMTLKQPYKLDAEGFLPPSVMTWEHKLTKEQPGYMTVVTPDGRVTGQTLALLTTPGGGNILSGSVVIFGLDASPAGQSVKWTGEHLEYAIALKDGTAHRQGRRQAGGGQPGRADVLLAHREDQPRRPPGGSGQAPPGSPSSWDRPRPRRSRTCT